MVIFNDKTITCLKANLTEGDYVRAEGSLRNTHFERNGETVFSTDLICEEFYRQPTKAKLSQTEETAPVEKATTASLGIRLFQVIATRLCYQLCERHAVLQRLKLYLHVQVRIDPDRQRAFWCCAFNVNRRICRLPTPSRGLLRACIMAKARGRPQATRDACPWALLASGLGAYLGSYQARWPSPATINRPIDERELSIKHDTLRDA